MNKDINYHDLTKLLSRVGIIIVAVVIVLMIIRFLINRKISSSLKIIDARNKVDPTIPHPPMLQFFGRSRSETIAINAFATILYEKGYNWRDIIVGYRPDFLRNPKTGRCLEIDAFFPDLKLGIEYNGIQHYKFPNHINLDNPKGRKDFEDTVERDELKNILAKQNSIRLISIPYYVNTCVAKDGSYKYKKNTDLQKWDLIKKYLENNMNNIPNKE